MEDNLNKPIVLDFFGLPGCGKSTVSHLVAEELRKQGKHVEEITYDIDHSLCPIKRKMTKLIRFFLYGVCHPIEMWRLINRIQKLENGFLESINLAMILVVRINAINRSKSDFVVLDEGCVQLSISLCQNSLNTDYINIAYKMLMDFLRRRNDVRNIFLDVSMNIAQERMQARGTSDSRIERENDLQNKKEILQYFERACNLMKNDKCITISGLDSPLEVAETLIKFLE